jgi:hypothetical protein
LATLAEISLQANAIDEQIQKDVVENNKEYFARMNLYEIELDTAVNLSESKLVDVSQQINQTKIDQAKYLEAEKAYDLETIANSIDYHQVSLEELQASQRVMLNGISTSNDNLSKARKDYQFWFNESLQERTGQDGRAPTEGPKYQRAVKTYQELKELIPVIEAGIVTQQANLDGIAEEIVIATDSLNEVQQIRNTLINKEENFIANQEVISNLEQELVATQSLLNLQIEDKQSKLEAFRITLQNEGLFFERRTGVLTRYLALKKIHSDSEFGEVATLFSYMLKIFFIAIELMPVIIKLFFSPFSFYSLKMYRKMQLALFEEKVLLEMADLDYQEKMLLRNEQFKQKSKAIENMKDSILI